MNARRSIAILLAGSLFAAALPGTKARALPQETVVVASSQSLAGLYVTGAFITVVAVLCLWDLVQKANGLKNWDGTPIKAKARAR